jgi:hypothetical protein
MSNHKCVVTTHNYTARGSTNSAYDFGCNLSLLRETAVMFVVLQPGVKSHIWYRV